MVNQILTKLEEEIEPGMRKCDYCGLIYEAKNSRHKFCSTSCYNRYWNKLHPSKKSKTENICAVCQRSFTASHKDTIYCSNECRREARKIAKGWKLTKQHWQNLREFTIERDNYTCQDCDKFLMDIGLEVHHIKPIFLGGTNEEVNLITLCHKCHKRRHMRFNFEK